MQRRMLCESQVDCTFRRSFGPSCCSSFRKVIDIPGSSIHVVVLHPYRWETSPAALRFTGMSLLHITSRSCGASCDVGSIRTAIAEESGVLPDSIAFTQMAKSPNPHSRCSVTLTSTRDWRYLSPERVLYDSDLLGNGSYTMMQVMPLTIHNKLLAEVAQLECHELLEDVEVVRRCFNEIHLIPIASERLRRHEVTELLHSTNYINSTDRSKQVRLPVVELHLQHQSQGHTNQLTSPPHCVVDQPIPTTNNMHTTQPYTHGQSPPKVQDAPPPKLRDAPPPKLQDAPPPKLRDAPPKLQDAPPPPKVAHTSEEDTTPWLSLAQEFNMQLSSQEFCDKAKNCMVGECTQLVVSLRGRDQDGLSCSLNMKKGRGHSVVTSAMKKEADDDLLLTRTISANKSYLRNNQQDANDFFTRFAKVSDGGSINNKTMKKDIGAQGLDFHVFQMIKDETQPLEKRLLVASKLISHLHDVQMNDPLGSTTIFQRLLLIYARDARCGIALQLVSCGYGSKVERDGLLTSVLCDARHLSTAKLLHGAPEMPRADERLFRCKGKRHVALVMAHKMATTAASEGLQEKLHAVVSACCEEVDEMALRDFPPSPHAEQYLTNLVTTTFEMSFLVQTCDVVAQDILSTAADRVLRECGSLPPLLRGMLQRHPSQRIHLCTKWDNILLWHEDLLRGLGIKI